jgi:hypothetical protein
MGTGTGTETGMGGVSVLVGRWVGLLASVDGWMDERRRFLQHSLRGGCRGLDPSIRPSVHPELGYIPDETALGQRGFGLLVAVMNACHVMWMDDSGLGVMTWR